MAEIPIEDKCLFEVDCEKIQLRTGANGDQVIMNGIEFGSGHAASMAWLINHNPGTMLAIEVKLKPV